jgi:hypothetical protein
LDCRKILGVVFSCGRNEKFLHDIGIFSDAAYAQSVDAEIDEKIDETDDKTKQGKK